MAGRRCRRVGCFLLLDSRDRRWCLASVALGAAALALHAWLDRRTPGGLTGGSTAGLWYGLSGTALVVFAGLLSAVRRAAGWTWLPPRRWWLRGHVWLGLLSAVFLLCHGGFRWGGPLERLLWVVFGLTLATGALGLALQQFLPGLITLRVPCEAPYEQIPHVCQVMGRKADALMETAEAALAPPGPEASGAAGAWRRLLSFYEAEVWPFLTGPYRRQAFLADPARADAAFDRLRAVAELGPVQEQVTQLKGLCRERRLLAEQERLHAWLHAWLLVHVPLAVALLVLGAAHATVALFY